MPTPLRMCPDSITDIADAADNTTCGRLLTDDLDFLEMGDLAMRRPRVWQPYIDRMDAVLVDRSADFASAVRNRMTRRPDPNILYDELLVDPVTRGFVERRGNGLAGLVMLHRLAKDATITSDDMHGDTMDLDVVSRHDRHILLDLDIPLGVDVTWRSNRMRLMRGLPSTISATVVGRRMSDVVSHPLIDGHGMTITGWDGVDLEVECDEPLRSVFA
jgi:hypothetical protein